MTAGEAFGEAFKGAGLEDFLWGALMLLVGAPVAIGFIVYGVLRLSDEDYTASPTFTVFCGCLGWWGALFLIGAASGGQGGDGISWFLMLCAGVGAAAGGYHLSREEKPAP
ncbi:hypothetical protein [Hymenobacter guriensis]|uniref:hypothetical protein n=1 Tax=Hymenobacter guriensis TaxID=2793065 RepID=UPI001E546729|nr:hypothetical protein [Hymenobacter guriensis]